VGLAVGAGAGFVVSWARLSDPAVIRATLLLRDPHVFLVMGSAVIVAAVGVRLVKTTGMRAVVTDEPIGWKMERRQAHHVGGSALFGIGWSVAGTCPGPVAAMVGEGRLGGLAVVAGLITGIALQRAWMWSARARAGAALRQMAAL
jgi:uncharacterized membrane protein YedE/YeeE